MTTLRLYNTLTRRKEEFAPINPSNVRLYVCGPTVYDFAHIGNARPVIVFDVLYRLLKHLYPGPGSAADGSRVSYVRNITDVDDKINARAARDFPGLPLNEAIRRVTEKTYDQFKADVAALGALPPTHEPRATEHIDGMVTIINTLLAKGHAYLAKGPEGREVLFSVGSMPDYGALSKRKLEDQVAGARVAVEAHKRNAADFVLWKESASDEPGWPGLFEGGVTIHGRPGWHIECSAMSQAFLGETFDIHGGGLDLIFPHHENEIAQSRCAHGTPVMANIWMHNGFLQVEGQKMSKSLGNFRTIRAVRDDWPGEESAIRLAMLKTNYKEPINWTHDRLNECSVEIKEYKARVRYAEPERGAVLPEMIDALCDDLNTHVALQSLRNAFARKVNQDDLAHSLVWLGLARSDEFELGREQRAGIRASIDRASLEVDRRDALVAKGIEPALVHSLIADRNAARAAKNFAESDRIRDELLTMGISLKDGKDEAGNPVTTWEVKR